MSEEADKSAFPLSGDWSQIKDKGMTLRDYFAGMALQGMLANPKLESQYWIEESAWVVADAMIKERSK